MIYLDTSVALAHLLAEDKQPPVSLWREELVSSRFSSEPWNRSRYRFEPSMLSTLRRRPFFKARGSEWSWRVTTSASFEQQPRWISRFGPLLKCESGFRGILDLSEAPGAW